jgi:hypothetical protein
LIEKYSKTKWFMTAFVWNDEQTDAAVSEIDTPTNLLVLENAKGTEHDVPGKKNCENCHYNMADKVLGFSGLQLDYEAEEPFLDLQELEEMEILSAPLPGHFTLPGTEAQQAALGYMHANCGECHNPWSQKAGLNLQFWLELGSLGSVAETPSYLTTVGQPSQAPQPPEGQPESRVIPMDLDNSAVYWRMTQPATFPREPEGGIHMPLIGTELTDEEGVALVSDWINSLEPAETATP